MYKDTKFWTFWKGFQRLVILQTVDKHCKSYLANKWGDDKLILISQQPASSEYKMANTTAGAELHKTFAQERGSVEK